MRHTHLFDALAEARLDAADEVAQFGRLLLPFLLFGFVLERAQIETALGEPTSVFWYDEAGSFTLNYAPHPSFPGAQFQAHFNEGRLKSIELYDD